MKLYPIDAASASSSPSSSSASSRPPSRSSRRPSTGFLASCPPGKAPDENGSCRSKASASSYACNPDNITECREQCDRGNPQSCVRVGWAYEKGEGVKEDVKAAFTAYKKACDKNDVEGCTGVGYLLSKSDDPADKAKSTGILRSACERGNGRACSGLGQQARIRRDLNAAYKDFDRGCRLGYTRACYYAGWALTKLDKDEARALSLMERACQGGDERGCLAAGSMYHQGTAGKKNPGEGAKLTSRGLMALNMECQQNKAESCEVLGDYYNGRYGKATPQGDKAVEFYDKACLGGQEDACFEVAAIYDGGIGGVKRSPSKAKENYERACKKGYDEACTRAKKVR